MNIKTQKIIRKVQFKIDEFSDHLSKIGIMSQEEWKEEHTRIWSEIRALCDKLKEVRDETNKNR